MMTVLEAAKAGKITPEIEAAAADEKIKPDDLMRLIADGEAIVCKNLNRANCKALAIGKGLRTKVNANIGTSGDKIDADQEMQKLKAALDAGADTVMDLSTGGRLAEMRGKIIAGCDIPVGTVPLYEAAVIAECGGKKTFDLDVEKIFAVLEAQAEEGVDFMTVHCGITAEGVKRLQAGNRILGVVSRGGSLTVKWMLSNSAENPLFEHYDRLLELCRRHEVVLSLGDGFRPGALADATDDVQLHELMVLGDLTKRAWEAGVQVMVEGPGHVPLDQIETNIKLQKRLCHGAPFYVLGPLVTDVAPGYDHITSAIGGALAAWAGADILCYVTPSEHLGLPTAEEVREGVIASRIAAHAADIAKKVPGARQWDDSISRARAKLDWQTQMELAVHPEKAMQIRSRCNPADKEVCSMCGDLCAIKTMK